MFYDGAPGEIRTHTLRILSPLTLPVGVPGQKLQDDFLVKGQFDFVLVAVIILKLVRGTGFEPAAFWLATRCSTKLS